MRCLITFEDQMIMKELMKIFERGMLLSAIYGYFSCFVRILFTILAVTIEYQYLVTSLS